MINTKVKFKIYGKIVNGIITEYNEKENFISINDGNYKMTIDYFNTIKIN